MTIRVNYAFSGFFSQFIVVCLMALFIVIAIFAMFFTSGTSNEMEWIGITVKPLEPETAAALGIPHSAGGVMVGETEGVAKRWGIRQGDVLLSINGQPVKNMTEFSKIVEETDLTKNGAQLDIIRQGSRIPVFVMPPGASPPPAKQRDHASPGRIARNPVVFDQQWLGIDAETFAAGEGRALGIPAGIRGVIIDGVARGSKAEQAGLATNDLIVSVNGQKINTANSLWRVLGRLDGADRVEFGIYRRGRLISVELPTAMATVAGGFPRRMGGGQLGVAGCLICPNCQTKVTHQWGIPYNSVLCPSCGTLMIRTQ
ncbi:MAG: PDZ domain-containing protein [Planctomycetota bacterium]|nr:MAG: PDZ domain-containing protein [Planctomycetota bacterium]